MLSVTGSPTCTHVGTHPANQCTAVRGGGATVKEGMRRVRIGRKGDHQGEVWGRGSDVRSSRIITSRPRNSNRRMYDDVP